MRPKLVVIGTVLIVTVISIRATWSQDQAPARAETSVPATEPFDISSPQRSTYAVDGFVSEKKGRLRRGDAPEFAIRAKLREAQSLANELKLANEPGSKADEKSKAELTKKLEAAVAAVFDADLTDREQRLAAVEQQLKNLRSSLDRRRNAKAEIVQLEVKVLANEAAGLGFSTRGQLGLEGTGPENQRLRKWWWDSAPAENVRK